MSDKIYLAKNGKTHGPFTAEEFEQIRLSGKITDYDAIFDNQKNSWEPLDLPPAPAPRARTSETPKAEPARAVKHPPEPQRTASLNVRPVEAVCHNFRSVVAGKLARVTETGCDLIATPVRDSVPCFAERGQVFLNLLDPSTGKAMDITARLTAISRTAEGAWAYRLEWQSCPQILLSA